MLPATSGPKRRIRAGPAELATASKASRLTSAGAGEGRKRIRARRWRLSQPNVARSSWDRSVLRAKLCETGGVPIERSAHRVERLAPAERFRSHACDQSTARSGQTAKRAMHHGSFRSGKDRNLRTHEYRVVGGSELSVWRR